MVSPSSFGFLAVALVHDLHKLTIARGQTMATPTRDAASILDARLYHSLQLSFTVIITTTTTIIIIIILIIIITTTIIITIVIIICCLSQEASGACNAGQLPPGRLVLSITNVVVRFYTAQTAPSNTAVTQLEVVYM